MGKLTSDKVILAADELETVHELYHLVHLIGREVYAVKIHNLYDELGPGIVRNILQAGAERVWVDLKIKDIPNTAKRRARAIQNSGAQILTVHAEGEIEMMLAAREGAPNMEIYAVTVLTSLDEDQTHLMTGQPVKAAVLYRARLAKLAGITNVVCSPKEVSMLHKRPELVGIDKITPGIRSAGKDNQDQKRVDTPASALSAGSRRLVIGRQLTQAIDPELALELLEAELLTYENSVSNKAKA